MIELYWVLKKEHHHLNLREERILETVNRIVSRIQNDQRNYK